MDSVFLRDFAVVISVAAATTLLCHALRQPAVIGYLLAGLIVGPHTPPFTLVRDLHSIHTMAELGLVVLMFVLGLEFSLPKLRRVGAKASLATLLEIFGMLGLGYAIGIGLGWSRNDSIYLGAILSISSTTIIIKVLTDLKMSKDDFAQTVFGILILEDIAAVVILAVLSGFGVSHENQGLTILRALIQVSFFVVIFLILGLAVIPRFLRWVGRFNSRTLLGLLALGLCLSSALIAVHFGFSVALGAFLIGAVIAASSEAEQIEEWIHPIRDLFSAIFFVSAGLLIDPRLLWTIKGPVALIAFVTVFGKTLTGAVGCFLAGYPLKTSVRVGLTLAQIGEFSFVFASLGLKTGLGSDFLYPLAVAVSAVTTLFTPYLIRSSDRIVDGLLRAAPASVTRALENYQERRSSERARSESAEILSRYGWRLGTYIVLLIAGFLFTKGVDHYLYTGEPTDFWMRIAIWGISWTLHLPLIHAVSGYINHFLLLSFTEFIVRTPAAGLLQKLPIQRTYELLETLLWLALAFIWAFQSLTPQSDRNELFIILGVMGVAVLLCRNSVRKMYSRLEALLDEIFGLASSEPLRQAAIAVEGPQSLLSDSIQRIMVNKGSTGVHQSLRDLGLREKTGASVIGIYREGMLNTNPSPQTIILPNDILVVIGSPEECRKAEDFLLE